MYLNYGTIQATMLLKDDLWWISFVFCQINCFRNQLEDLNRLGSFGKAISHIKYTCVGNLMVSKNYRKGFHFTKKFFEKVMVGISKSCCIKYIMCPVIFCEVFKKFLIFRTFWFSCVMINKESYAKPNRNMLFHFISD